MRTILVAGISGAGQSQAIKTFEDLGFYCVEHLPAVTLEPTLDALERAGCADVAMTIDVRGDARLGDPLLAIDTAMARRGAQLLFLDAQDEVLIRRYSETRRRHPVRDAASVSEAIDADRRALSPFRERATAVIDTTSLTHAALKERISAAFAPERRARLGVTIVAFGFKFGLPRDLDLLLDVRFLRNPNYVPELKPLTGNDAAVAAYIDEDAALSPFLEKSGALLEFLLPRYAAEGKAQLTIGVGCTGGRHRSVYVARRLGERLAHEAGVELAVEARDLPK
ncbi:MAG TPA: RNase adapter RapZ [Verrucomicrobiae bacterium]|nr:RNase adapter RapZ [Verrucomicrobiae bacterium]